MRTRLPVIIVCICADRSVVGCYVKTKLLYFGFSVSVKILLLVFLYFMCEDRVAVVKLLYV